MLTATDKKPFLTNAEFMAFLQDLAASKIVRVVGSYAKGTQNIKGTLSDLDLWVLRDREGMDVVKSIFDAHGVEWDSEITGHVATPRDAQYMPIPVEASYLFRCKTGRTFPLSVYGVPFLAYKQD